MGPIWETSEVHFGMQFHEKTALWAVTAMRSSFDLVTGYGPGRMNECKWLVRIVFLETVAGVPGMVGGMVSSLSCVAASGLPDPDAVSPGMPCGLQSGKV